jgi:hypothetical protein
MTAIGYASGFGNECATGALPAGQNSPQRPPYGLYAEPADFLTGLCTLAGAGGPAQRAGAALHLYGANRSMADRVFADADGELLLVPERGALLVFTELGRLAVASGEFAVVPRGVRFRVELLESEARGYVCENYGAAFRLPELGPIGANGLANSRDFRTPLAAFEDRDTPTELIVKFGGRLWRTELDHSPLDVVAWHGNYAPYKYDLARFNTLGSVSFDHPDPSIFTVLSSPSLRAGTANVDFVIFPPRWLVAEHTFRPPWFSPERDERVHGPAARNVRCEGVRFRAGGRQSAHCAYGPRSRCCHIRTGDARRTPAGQGRRHAGVHVRDVRGPRSDRASAREPGASARLRQRVARLPEEVQPRTRQLEKIEAVVDAGERPAAVDEQFVPQDEAMRFGLADGRGERGAIDSVGCGGRGDANDAGVVHARGSCSSAGAIEENLEPAVDDRGHRHRQCGAIRGVERTRREPFEFSGVGLDAVLRPRVGDDRARVVPGGNAHRFRQPRCTNVRVDRSRFAFVEGQSEIDEPPPLRDALGISSHDGRIESSVQSNTCT